MVGARGFLKREGFDFDKTPGQLDKAFLKLFPSDEAENIRQIWTAIHVLGGSPTKLYSVPRTLQQAHLLMSHDRDRYLAAFDWIRTKVEGFQPTSIVEMGSGTGVLLRYLAANFPGMIFKGIDSETALTIVAPDNPAVSLSAGDYLSAPATSKFAVIICNFGFDLDNFEASKTPHSIDQIGESRFCPGCSDDLAVQLTEYLAAWRRWGTADAKLLMVGRIPDFGVLRAVAISCGKAGWFLDFPGSDILKVQNSSGMVERFPALLFRPGGPSGNNDIDELELFYRSTPK